MNRSLAALDGAGMAGLSEELMLEGLEQLPHGHAEHPSDDAAGDDVAEEVHS